MRDLRTPDVKPLSQMAIEQSKALCLKCIGMAVIPDGNDQPHGVALREQGFYPIGHKSGIIVLSYYDSIQKAIIYEKLVFSRAVKRSQVEVERVKGDERLVFFED